MELEHGKVSVDGQTLVDTTRGVFVPKHRRRIGYVFQDSRLFPHLSVRQNLLYGRWFSRSDGGVAGDFNSIVELLGIGPLTERDPTPCRAARSSGSRSAARCSPIRACC